MKRFKFVQVGAHTGFTQEDWFLRGKINADDNCIFIEPVKELFDKLVQNYNENFKNNNFIFINKAISNYTGTLDLYTPDLKAIDIASDLPHWADQLTSVLPEHVKAHSLDIPVRKITVECCTLQDIITEYEVGSLDFLQIDTEGHDKEVLEGLNLTYLKPKNVVFEKKHLDGTNYVNKLTGTNYHSTIFKFLNAGYTKVYENDLDIHFQLTE